MDKIRDKIFISYSKDNESPTYLSILDANNYSIIKNIPFD
jgi:hypothetical protein